MDFQQYFAPQKEPPGHFCDLSGASALLILPFEKAIEVAAKGLSADHLFAAPNALLLSWRLAQVTAGIEQGQIHSEGIVDECANATAQTLPPTP